jgi:Ala-tRNA(Pro) deacylase
MALNRRLAELFGRNRASYELVTHPEAYTAQEVAERARVPGRQVAKVVVARDRDGSYVMAVVPAPEHVDLSRLGRVTGRHGLSLIGEDEMRGLFPDCEPGAMPPFGSLYGMWMCVDPCLAQLDHLYFQAGNHLELIQISYDEFDRLAAPFTGDVCLHECHAFV